MAIDTHEIERQIIERAVRDMLGAGYVVSVNDGGATTVRESADEAAIMAALFSTDENILFFRNPGGIPTAGWVHFIWGNGWDQPADCSDNEATRAVMAGADKLAAALEAEHG